MMLTAIAAYLLADTQLTTAIADRVHYSRRPAGSNYPCLVLDPVATRPLDVLDGLPECDSVSIEFHIWCDDASGGYPKLSSVGDRVRELLEGYRGDLGGYYVHGCKLDSDIHVPTNPIDGSDVWIYRRSLTLRFTANNNLARS